MWLEMTRLCQEARHRRHLIFLDKELFAVIFNRYLGEILSRVDATCTNEDQPCLVFFTVL